MAAEIKQALGVEPELAKGANGIFDVWCGENAADGELVFSRHRDNRFPDAEEIIEAIRRSSRPKP